MSLSPVGRHNPFCGQQQRQPQTPPSAAARTQPLKANCTINSRRHQQQPLINADILLTVNDEHIVASSSSSATSSYCAFLAAYAIAAASCALRGTNPVACLCCAPCVPKKTRGSESYPVRVGPAKKHMHPLGWRWQHLWVGRRGFLAPRWAAAGCGQTTRIDSGSVLQSCGNRISAEQLGRCRSGQADKCSVTTVQQRAFTGAKPQARRDSSRSC